MSIKECYICLNHLLIDIKKINIDELKINHFFQSIDQLNKSDKMNKEIKVITLYNKFIKDNLRSDLQLPKVAKLSCGHV